VCCQYQWLLLSIVAHAISLAQRLLPARPRPIFIIKTSCCRLPSDPDAWGLFNHPRRTGRGPAFCLLVRLSGRSSGKRQFNARLVRLSGVNAGCVRANRIACGGGRRRGIPVQSRCSSSGSSFQLTAAVPALNLCPSAQ
jgi:hypothetical protein